MGVYAAVIAIDTEGIMIEHSADDAGCFNAVALAVGEFDRGSVGKIEARARALPERDLLGLLKTSVLVMERVGLEENVRGGAKIGVHDNMLKVARAEPLHAADVEQGGHSGHTADSDGHLVSGVANKLGIEDGVRGRERLAVLLVEAIQQVDAPGVPSPRVGAAAVHGVESLCHHVVDGTHDEVVKSNCHSLLNLIEKHGQEAVELGGAGEGLIQRLLLHRALDLERGHLVEELDVHIGLVEHVGIIGRPVGEIPALVLGGGGKAGTDLLQNRAVAPVIHHDGRSAARIGAVDEDHLADMVDEGANKAVKRVGIENLVAGVHDAVKILGDQIVLAESLGERGIDDFINLFYFHCCSPFSLVD